MPAALPTRQKWLLDALYMEFTLHLQYLHVLRDLERPGNGNALRNPHNDSTQPCARIEVLTHPHNNRHTVFDICYTHPLLR